MARRIATRTRRAGLLVLCSLAAADPAHGHSRGGAAGHACVHDEIMSTLARAKGGHRARHNATVARQLYAGSSVDGHGRELQSTFAPVRIVVDTSLLATGA